jgi:hypothetical protein
MSSKLTFRNLKKKFKMSNFEIFNGTVTHFIKQVLKFDENLIYYDSKLF